MGGELAQLVRMNLGTVSAITFSCAAIHFRDVYKLHDHQRSALLTPCL